MINKTSFKSQHYVKTPDTVSGYDPFTAEYSIKYLIESFPVLKKQNTTIEAVSQCGGLVCCFDAKRGRHGQYYVCRPATGQCVTLYSPNLIYRTVATAIVTNIGGSAAYKIIRFSMPKNNNNDLACEIFYSRHATWYRFTDIPQVLHFTRYVRSRQTRPVFANGYVNWLVTDTEDNKMYIFSFDVENETWRLIQVPPKPIYVDVKWISKIAVNVGKLCYVLMLKDEPEMIVWTLETHMIKQWWRNEKVNFMQANKFKEELDMEFRHCSKPGTLNCFFTNLWKKFGKSKFLPGECLASKYLT